MFGRGHDGPAGAIPTGPSHAYFLNAIFSANERHKWTSLAHNQIARIVTLIGAIAG
jgi:hypothetical protein